MNTFKTSRRKFLGRSSSLAVGLPLAAAIPSAIEKVASPTKVEAASADDIRQPIPNRTLPSLAIGSQRTTVSGLYTDAKTDCSLIINTAILNMAQAGGGTVFIPSQPTPLPNSLPPAQCVYMIDPQANGDGSSVPYHGVTLQSNVRIECAPGVKLQAITINTNSSKLTDRAYMFYGGLGSDGNPIHDVEIANCWLVGERYTHIYSGISPGTDEHCYGIALYGVKNVNIRATYISDCTGDGICIGSLSNASPSNVTLCDVISTGNRRQGMSITAGSSIAAYDSEFSYTAGTAPGDGIDIEPQGTDSVSNVTIDNCVIRGNAANGIELNASKGSVTGVNVVNCLIDYNSYAGFFAGSANTGTVYGNAFFQNGWYGIHLGGNTESYIVGGYSSGGYDSNSFANNGIHNNTNSPITYPNPTETNTSGVISGNDINITSTLPNTIQWNSYFTS